LINWNIDANTLNQNQPLGYGASMYGNGISGYNCDNLQIINTTITNCRMYGVNYGSDKPNLCPVSVINCTLLYNSWNGICFWAGEGGTIMNNEVAHSSDVGISVSTSTPS
jgi:parallel beta-helix repeat protein